MHILITGAGGFVGQILTEALLNEERGLYHLTLTDVCDFSIPAAVKWPQNAKIIKGDLAEALPKLIDQHLDAAFVLHGIMSWGAEENFELGINVNFDATRALFDAFREKCPSIRVIFTSSNAVYGSDVSEGVNESMRPLPESSYGCEKLMCECLINEYTRRKFFNGFIVRLPSISVRPGKPSAAASSFFSGIIREPLQNIPCVVPLEDRKFGHWLSSPRTLVKNLIHCLSLPAGSLSSHDRTINLPGIGVTVQSMMDSLARVGGQDKLKYVSEKEDPKLAPILYSWPRTFDNSKPLSLGFTQDKSFDDVVQEFKLSLEK